MSLSTSFEGASASVAQSPTAQFRSATFSTSTLSSNTSSAAVDIEVSVPVLSASSSASNSEDQYRPKRLRPSEISQVYMYREQETIRASTRAPESTSSQPTGSAARIPSSRSNNSSSDRWSVTKNVTNVTTGNLDLGELPMLVSPELVERFMEISEQNSANQIETGGLLAGVVEESVKFKVTTLVIPGQRGRSDYWEAIDPVNLQSFFTENNLLLLGCIHTHPPPWTSFLSSVDLHQLFDFQKDNPSAVSIVIAPAHMPTHVPACVYSLTDMGLTVLADCRKTGVHQHRYNTRYHFDIEINFSFKEPKYKQSWP